VLPAANARRTSLPQNANWAVKFDFALPLFDPPGDQSVAKRKSEAIDDALKATCHVEARGAGGL
jgi:hypothetical protein